MWPLHPRHIAGTYAFYKANKNDNIKKRKKHNRKREKIAKASKKRNRK